MAIFLTKDQIKTRLETFHKKKQVPDTVYEELKSELKGKKLTKSQLEQIIREIINSYEFAQIDPGSAVGTVAAQSIGEPGTQMSIPGNEKVLVKSKNNVEIVEIGDFIDNLIENNDCYILDNETSSIVYDLPNTEEYHVLGISNDEKIKWQKVLQVSRHNPNGDLLKIKTRTGRTITSTFSHAFVIRQNNEIVPVRGDELSLGDRLPVAVNIPSSNPLIEVNVSEYLPKNEVWHSSELAVAVSMGSNWREGYGKSYTVPVKEEALWKAIKTEKIQEMEENCCYPKMYQNKEIKIPESIPLTPELGWFIGAYLAEGGNTSSVVSITNSNKRYLQNVEQLAEVFGINTSTSLKEGEYGPSTSIHLHSTLFAKLMLRLCGRTSKEKHVPSWTINTSDEFIGFLLRGYFDGDGNVSVDRSMIRASSSSKQLRDGICLLLSRLGILAKKSKSQFEYKLTIPGKYAHSFYSKIGLDLEHKDKLLRELVKKENSKKFSYDSVDMIPGLGTILKDIKNKLSIPSRTLHRATKNEIIGRQTCKKYIEEFTSLANSKDIDISKELSILKQACNSDVIWDEIIGLEKIESPTPFVYDFGVSELETFLTAEGIITHNTLQTFHYSGVAEMSVLRGLPRLIEILDARKNPSTPTMSIYLDPATEKSENLSKQVARRIELTTVNKVAHSITHSFSEGTVRIKLDELLLKDKDTDADTVMNKIQLRRKETKVEIDSEDSTVIVITPLKEIKFSDLPKLAEKIREIPIKGIKNVNRVVVMKSKDDKYYLQSEGSNFSELLRIPGVDPTRCYTTDINQIAETLGIEAARNALVKESLSVMKEQGLDVDKRHVMLVSDLMSHTGEILQIGRHGVSGNKSSVFARAAFEVTVKHLLDAAVHGEYDPLEGITENVIVGQTIALGTGIVDLTMSANYREFSDKDKE